MRLKGMHSERRGVVDLASARSQREAQVLGSNTLKLSHGWDYPALDIDWLSINIPTNEPPVTETWYTEDETGKVRQITQVGRSVEGSWSKKIKVHITGSRLTISGNVTKFLTGQNVIGCSNLRFMIEAIVSKVYELIGRTITLETRQAIAEGNVSITRIDLCEFKKLENLSQARDFLAALDRNTICMHNGRGNFRGSTIRWGGGHTWSLTCYIKELEIQVHKINCDPELKRFIEENIKGLVRFESRIRGSHLKPLGLHLLKNWDDETGYNLHQSLMSKLKISEGNDRVMPSEKLRDMPKHLLAPYMLWQNGFDVRGEMYIEKRSTFYRVRRQLIEKYAVDIAIPKKVEDKNANVIPIVRVLEAKPWQPSSEIQEKVMSMMS